jgi:hypothetical protein
VADSELRNALLTLVPKAREHLCAVLIRDHADRDAIASRLMRYRDQNGQDACRACGFPSSSCLAASS